MYLRRLGNARAAVPTALLVAAALGLALLIFGAGHGRAAVFPIGGADSTDSSESAICAVAPDRDRPFEVTFVETSDCPGTDDGDPLDADTRWIELDFSGSTIRSDFAPAKGELDGLRPGARINLRDTGVRLNEIDLSQAISDENGGLYKALGSDPPSSYGLDDPTGYPPTILLDGGRSETGLGTLPRSVDEGGILYIPFYFGTRPNGLNFPVKVGLTCTLAESCTYAGSLDGERGRGASVHEISVEHRGLDVERTVYVMASSDDPDDTLYVVPVPTIRLSRKTIGRDRGGKRPGSRTAIRPPRWWEAATPLLRLPALEYLYARPILDGYDDDYEDTLRISSDTVLVEDDDEPAYPVCDRHPQVQAAIEGFAGMPKCRKISLDRSGKD